MVFSPRDSWPSRLTLTLAAALAGIPANAGLLDYVKTPDQAFAWKANERLETPKGTIVPIDLTSQVWHGISWKHQFVIYEPKNLESTDTVLLFITGGSTDSRRKPEDDLMAFRLAELTRARVALLPQVPNQPLFGDKKEDDLITETFLRYLDSHDGTWPLLFPMVKSAVRAMDTVQAFVKAERGQEVKNFVVTGGSKRGWTTWLTAASDGRVLAIAPMVIDTLNMKAQMKHAKETWGRMSEQIDDYTSKGLTEKFETEWGKQLWQMVDPYTYRDQLSLPKLIINGTNDRYWTQDALNIYWDELVGLKSVVYVPNAGHSLNPNREYAIHGIAALFRHAVKKEPFPELRWEHSDSADNHLKLTVEVKPAPKTAKLWVARTNTNDFRDSKWEPQGMTITPSLVTGEIHRPKSGNLALFGDMEYEVDGFSYHLSTQIRVVREPKTAAGDSRQD